jgi:CRISPR system Cascade subunit CasD
MTRYLLLWLQAPLQSWGHDSKFGRRDTLNFPTKSGVMGLICCALGAGGEQRELLAEFAPLKQTVISFVRCKKNGVKGDREPLLRDFHMIGSGYDDKDPWQTLLIPKTAEGKKAVGGGTKITYRYYLQDAFFAVILEVPSDKADTLAQALQTPVWDLCLGRKSCVPTDFVFRGIFDSEADAVEQAVTVVAHEKNLQVDFCVFDDEYKLDKSLTEILTLNDVPEQFGEQKVYRDRRVTVINL